MDAKQDLQQVSGSMHKDDDPGMVWVRFPEEVWQRLRTFAIDELPERPEPIDEPLPEELERLLRDPEVVTRYDWDIHRKLREHVRAHPGERIPGGLYLALWALIDVKEASGEEA